MRGEQELLEVTSKPASRDDWRPLYLRMVQLRLGRVCLHADPWAPGHHYVALRCRVPSKAKLRSVFIFTFDCNGDPLSVSRPETSTSRLSRSSGRHPCKNPEKSAVKTCVHCKAKVRFWVFWTCLSNVLSHGLAHVERNPNAKILFFTLSTP